MPSDLQPPSVPDLDGYIYKMKSKQSIFGSWVKRYFKINRVTECLEYYSSKPNGSDIKPSGSIQLQRLNSVRKFDGNCLQVSKYANIVAYLISYYKFHTFSIY